ncbi:hypothetical protein NB717_000028 [Xanthomonas sacchari]|uniref:hypothetical protein n=1 Tax=Xanthomonas sacchari TaxID=56458 RepID=UPI00225E3BF6|nr:hypothetical protein [Xanthomonas sacchari]MCW0458960.1 hypothetical protein [Xanthomonas sacchari]
MTDYQLTEDPNVVVRRADGTSIPRGHRWWDEYEAWLAAGNAASPLPVTRADLVAETKDRIGAWLDEVARSRGYDSIVSCASYAASTNEQFKAEAAAAIAWRDAVYAKGYELLANTPEGVETPEAVLALLPQPGEFGWPTA